MSAEPVSPELVLVSPEVREEAVAAMPKLPWELGAARDPERPEPEAAQARASNPTRDNIAALLQIVRMAAIVAFAGVALTLALTLVADALR